jgi:hypothetical protein
VTWVWITGLGFEMGTCQLCKHHQPELPDDQGRGRCSLLSRANPAVKAVGLMAYHAPIHTADTFGCCLWLQKDLDLSEVHR